MTTTLGTYAVASSRPEPLSPGVGAEAWAVDRSLGAWRDTRMVSLTLSRFEPWLDLADVLAECRAEGWDGEDAEPVSPATIAMADRFLSALPSGIPDPEVGADPDGEVSFGWCTAPDWGVAIALNANGRLSYAAIFGANRVHGTERFRQEIPVALLQVLRRLLG